MALRNQPYLPLYIQDFLTDEKLLECSAEATGVYIRLMCVMHKSEEYGTILLKQKNKQTGKQIEDFACQLAKTMPYRIEVIHKALHELINEGVLIIESDKLLQKRMIRDNSISQKRSIAGQKGGFATTFAQANVQANTQANSEIEYEYANEDKFLEIWIKYPNKDGKKAAFKSFLSSVKTDKDFTDIKTALKNYLVSEKVKKGFIKNGSTWFNNWRDWIDWKPIDKPKTYKAA